MARGSTAARGYGASHVRATKAMAVLVEAGGISCVLCGREIVNGKIRLRGGRVVRNWVLDHTLDRSGYRGVAHFLCNAREAAPRGGRAFAARQARRRPRVPGGVFGPLSS